MPAAPFEFPPIGNDMFGGHLRVSHRTHELTCAGRICHWDPMNKLLFVPTDNNRLHALRRLPDGTFQQLGSEPRAEALWELAEAMERAEAVAYHNGMED